MRFVIAAPPATKGAPAAFCVVRLPSPRRAPTEMTEVLQ